MGAEISGLGDSGAHHVLMELVLVLGFAAVAGVVARMAGVSVIVGYIAAGVVLGPGVSGLVANDEIIGLLGETGVALLLFTIGLELRWHKVRSVMRVEVVSGAVQLTATAILVFAVALALGVSPVVAAVFAMAVPLSSTAVVLRTLADREELDTAHGHAALGVLVAQDLATLGILIAVDRLADAGSGLGVVAVESAQSVLGLVALAALVLGVDRLLLRPILRHAAVRFDAELLAVLSITLSLAAIGVANLLALPAAVGGFIAGVVLGDAPYSDRLRSDIAPLRFALATLFFASIGALVQPEWVAANALLVGGVAGAVLMVKFALAYGAVRAARVAAVPAAIAAVSLAQLGELSFVVVREGARVGIVDNDAFQLFVSVSALTILATPFLIAGAVRVAMRGRADEPAHTTVDAGPDGGLRAVVVGYGVCGAGVVDELVELGVETVVVDVDPGLASSGRVGVAVVQGDGTSHSILRMAGVADADVVVVAVPGPLVATLVTRATRRLNADAVVVTRCRHHAFLDQIDAAGADFVVNEELEATRALVRAVDVLCDSQRRAM